MKNKTESNRTLNCYTKISRSSAAIKIGVKLHLLCTVYVCEQRRLWRDCAGLSEPLLLSYAIRVIISLTGLYVGNNLQLLLLLMTLFARVHFRETSPMRERSEGSGEIAPLLLSYAIKQ